MTSCVPLRSTDTYAKYLLTVYYHTYKRPSSSSSAQAARVPRKRRSVRKSLSPLLLPSSSVTTEEVLIHCGYDKALSARRPGKTAATREVGGRLPFGETPINGQNHFIKQAEGALTGSEGGSRVRGNRRGCVGG